MADTFLGARARGSLPVALVDEVLTWPWLPAAAFWAALVAWPGVAAMWMEVATWCM